MKYVKIFPRVTNKGCKVATVDFDEIRRTTGSIHVYDTVRGLGTEVKPTTHDVRCQRAHGHTTGSGTHNNPYRYKSAEAFSRHFALIDLWCAYRPDPQKPEVFASIGDLLVIFTYEGIRALDGKFTRLLP